MESNKQNTQNPWLGLKSYSEGKKLYGRDNEITELSQKIIYNTQTIIYGRSGIGKSSLLKAGVFPILRKHGFFPVYIRLIHDDEQNSYSSQIFSAVEGALQKLKIEVCTEQGYTQQIIEGTKECVVPKFNPDNEEETLWEYFHRHKFQYLNPENGEKVYIMPALMFDQFEEIFTLQKNDKKIKSFFDEFAGLINNIPPHELTARKTEESEVENVVEKSINSTLITKIRTKGGASNQHRNDYITDSLFHFVISIREDFLSHLERNITHIPLLKHNRYCLQPLNEECASEIIMKPCPGLISVEVAKEIISKVTGAKYESFEIDNNPELEVDSAILSLFLSELYKKKEKEATRITREDVIKQGKNIIPDFYEETIRHISETSAQYLERRLVTKEGRRDAIYIEQAKRHGLTDDELKYLLTQRLLHKYPWRDELRIEFSHDILCHTIIKRRNEREALFEKARKEEILKKQKKEKYQKYINTFLLIIILSIPFISILYYDGWVDIKIERYADTTKQNTWIVGLNKLSEEEAEHLNCSYWFYKKGRWAKYAFMIEARDGYGNLTANSSLLANNFVIENKETSSDTNNELTVRWIQIPDNTGKYCIQLKEYNKDNKLLYYYNISKTKNDNQYISTYTDGVGFPIPIDSNYVYIRTTLDENGRECLKEYYNEKGLPITNNINAYQTAYTYFPNGMQESEASLFLNGSKMIDKAGNCSWKVLETTENGLQQALYIYLDANDMPCTIDENGVMAGRKEYDEYGRLISETYWKYEANTHIEKIGSEDIDNLIADTTSSGVHRVNFEYNEHGQTTRVENLNLEGNPVNSKYGHFLIIRDYDDKGNMTKEYAYNTSTRITSAIDKEFTSDGKCIYHKGFSISEKGDTILYYHLYKDKTRDIIIIKDYYPYNDYYKYTEKDMSDKILLIAHYSISDNKPLGDSDGLHKTTYEYTYLDSVRTIETERFFNTDDKPCRYSERYPYHKNVIIVDSTEHSRSIIRYTTDNIRSEGYDDSDSIIEYFYNGTKFVYTDKNFNTIIAESSLDEYSRICRYYENAAYFYTAKYIKSIKTIPDNKSYGHYAVNEFGEPSLIRSENNNYSVYYDGISYNEQGELITKENPLQPLLCALEAPGDDRFRIGDILVEMDDWTMWIRKDKPSVPFYDLDTEPSNDVPHHFKVLRFNEETKEYDFMDIDIPIGDSKLSNISYKKYYCTTAEYKRIERLLKQHIYPHMFEFVPNEDGALSEQGMKHEGLVLQINDWDMTTHFTGSIDSLKAQLSTYDGMTKNIMIYNETNDSVYSYKVESDTLGVRINSYSLKPRYYKQILERLNKEREVHSIKK